MHLMFTMSFVTRCVFLGISCYVYPNKFYPVPIVVFTVPSHVCPSPEKPGLHVQEYEPTVFIQSAYS